MAVVLDTLAVSLRTSLDAVSGLAPLPENVSIDDVPANQTNAYFSVEVGEHDELGAMHGGGTYVERTGELTVKLAFGISDDEEAFHDTKAQVLQGVAGVMDKVSNWTSGIVLVSRNGSTSAKDGTFYRTDLNYRVRYRVAQDLT